jgi:uncharacterized membrane protein/protein-disulfide isomerase
MQRSLTLNGAKLPRALSFISGLGMMLFSALTIQHFFAANYPETIWQGSFCDISAFFNCNSSAFSSISAVMGVPLGYFGLLVGALVTVGAAFPSVPFERTNKTIAMANVLGVVSLLLYSMFVLKSLCLLCSGFYVFSIISAVLFWKYGIDGDAPKFFRRYLQPSVKYLVTFGLIMAAGAYGMREYHETKKMAQSGGVAARVVKQYFALPVVKTPSLVSPYRIASSTEKFEDAPIQVIEYADFLCPDCLYLHSQLQKLQEEFKGKINIAYQFFPLEGKCNSVVEKDIHPGACETAYIAAYDPARFAQIHDELFANYTAVKKNPEFRRAFARQHGLEAAFTDPRTQEIVRRIINTGAEFEKTSDKYSHGIRSTPTMIVNNRMIIGTFPYEQLRAIFQALVEEKDGQQKFMENWEDTRKKK